MKASGKVGYWEATAIGVGGMVGGGIFAVLGLAVQLAAGGTPVAFAIAGFVALITTYSYVKLSVAFPGQGGTVSYLNRAFGAGVTTGGLNVLLWISYVVMLSLYSAAFGSYGAALLPEPLQAAGKHTLISFSIVAITALNTLSAKAVGEAEDYIVGVKIAILLVFVVTGFAGIQTSRLALSTWAPPLHLVAGGVIIFVAYEGFELIANAAGDVADPRRTLPKAFYSAVGFVIVLYVVIAAVTVGNLPLSHIVQAKDYALAEAARPFLGQAGFTLIAAAALLSTASAINATLYGAARLSYRIAKDGELPEALEKKVWNEPLEGLFITAALTLLVANTFQLDNISTMGSAGFLLIFAAVNVANLRMASHTKSVRWLPALGVVACTGALSAMVWQSAQDSPTSIWVLAAMLGLSFGIEATYRAFTGRSIRVSPGSHGNGSTV